MSLLRQLAISYHPSEFDSTTTTTPKTTETFPKCDQLRIYRNSTDNHGTADRPTGIYGLGPNLVVNMLIFSSAVLLFWLLKRKMFNRRDPGGERVNIHASTIRTKTFANLMYGEMMNTSYDHPPDEEEYARRRWHQRLTHLLSESDYLLLTRGGVGALEYIRFQRYVIGMSAMVAFMSVCIVLPVNAGGVLLTDPIGSTSIFNIMPMSPRLWVPVWFTLILFPLGFVAMRAFGYHMPVTEGSSEGDSATLMISGLPVTRANVEMIRAHFTEGYRDCEVTDVCLSFDVSELNKLETELRQTEECLRYLADHPERAPDMKVKTGGCLGLGSKKVDAAKYYNMRKTELQQQLNSEGRRWRKINPVFFVTFANKHQAGRVFDDYQPCGRLCGSEVPVTAVSEDIKAKNWTAYYAPDPRSVNWENLGNSGFMWYLRITLINLLLLALIAISVTIVVALNYSWVPNLHAILTSPGLSQISPALVLLLMQKLLPEVIVRGTRWVGYWTKQRQTVSEMHLIYLDLLLAIVLLPSLGLIGSVLSLVLSDPSLAVRRECISLPDNGALYANYLVFVAFTSTACSLLRVGVILDYLVRRWKAKSEPEIALAGQVLRPFAFGEEYAKFLIIFTLTMIFAFVSPLVSLIGLLAMTIKYFVDQYLLCNVYQRTPVGNTVHSVAISQFFGALLIQLLMVSLIFIVRNGMDGKAAILILAVICYASTYMAMMCFGLCEKASIFQLLSNGGGDYPSGPVDLSRRRYLPDCLQRLDQLDTTAAASRGLDQPQ